MPRSETIPADACPSVLHGGSRLALGTELEDHFDELMKELGDEVRALIRAPRRHSALHHNPGHQTMIVVQLALIDQDAASESYVQLVKRQHERWVEILRFTAQAFEKTRRVLKSLRN